MNSESKKDKILLHRLAYFFKRFKPEQKQFMADSVDNFLAEPPEKAARSKSLSKILDFMTQKVFKPIGKFGRTISPSKLSPQAQKKRRDKMKPSFLVLHRSSKIVQARYQRALRPARTRRHSKKKTQQIENDR